MKRNRYEKPIEKTLPTRVKKSRSVKARPQSAIELVTAIDAGKLDGRTGPARKITSLRAALENNPVEVCKGLIKDALSIDAVITQALVKEISRPGFEPMVDGGKRLNPVLVLWKDIERSLIYTAQTLARMESQPTAQLSTASTDKPCPTDVSSLILEAAADEPEQ